MDEPKDKHKIHICDLLKSFPEGLTVQEIMDKTGLARHTVLARLHHFIGQGKVTVKQINMAKVHKWVGQEEKKPAETPHEEVKEQIVLQPLTEEHITQLPLQKKDEKEASLDMEKIKQQIEEELRTGKIEKTEAQIKEQRAPILHVVEKTEYPLTKKTKEFLKTGIPGFDELLEQGIPKGYSILIAGGAGSGKTIFCLQLAANHARHGEKCLYMSFEESEEHLVQHMQDFGWNPKELIDHGTLMIKRFNPFDITRQIDALLMKAKGELLIDIKPIIFPENFIPDFVFVDSLTAIASAFIGKDESYRIYIEQLFRLFEELETTAFLISETKQVPVIFSQSGVEEFLADGVIVLYSFKRGNIRENAIEVLKLRGAKHQKKIVAMQITDEGIVVYPEQEVFGEFKEEA